MSKALEYFNGKEITSNCRILQYASEDYIRGCKLSDRESNSLKNDKIRKVLSNKISNVEEQFINALEKLKILNYNDLVLCNILEIAEEVQNKLH